MLLADMYLNVQSQTQEFYDDLILSNLQTQKAHGAVNGLKVVNAIALQLQVLQNVPVQLHATLHYNKWKTWAIGIIDNYIILQTPAMFQIMFTKL